MAGSSDFQDYLIFRSKLVAELNKYVSYNGLFLNEKFYTKY